ncbi:hypothetical protein [Amycolatopsis sp. w19]|uniref:hypothetical protein n=1 Tax=Amycolatopsis sp. w19 TaxID=3448134 RepID=UPI003F1D2B28
MALLGFGSLVVFAVVATESSKAHSPIQAGVALGVGAVSVVTIFVSGRAAGPLFERSNPDQAKNETSP